MLQAFIGSIKAYQVLNSGFKPLSVPLYPPKGHVL